MFIYENINNNYKLNESTSTKDEILIHNILYTLKVPGPIASDFYLTFGDFGIRRKLIFFSLPLVNFTALKCTVWKILMKM